MDGMGCKTESGRKKGMYAKEMVRPFFCSASSCLLSWGRGKYYTDGQGENRYIDGIIMPVLASHKSGSSFGLPPSAH